MRHLLLRIGVSTLAVALLMLVGVQWRPATASAAPGAAPVRYYLALGDSLSQGVQPTSTAPGNVTNEGYVDDLYAHYHARVPSLRLMKLGCPGESTTSMIEGGGCSYAAGSQLNAAVSFLRQHRVGLVTFDIGPNDILICLREATIEALEACVKHQVDDVIAPNLMFILTQLRQAAGPEVPMFAMNFYDPYLAAWLQGNQLFARASVQLVQYLNAIEGQIYKRFHIRVANVEQAFQTTNFTPIQPGGLPVNVATICAWTWMCTGFQDIHANVTGYAVIAATFERVIRGRAHAAPVGPSAP